MRILVTGSHGFIGRHLCPQLQDRGHEMLGIDRQATARANRHDLRQSIRPVLERYKPDLVVHLAAHVGRLFGEDDMIAAITDNAQATTLLARDCGELGIRVAYASTSEIYGDRGDHVCHETDPLDVLPHNLYGLSKRWGEEACQLYSDRPTIFRFSMPYGPGVAPGRGRRALDTMLWQAHHALPITVHHGAERSWCWVGDTVRAIIMVLENTRGGIWNVGRDDVPVPMLDLARKCCELCDRDPAELVREVPAPGRQTVVKRLATSKIRGLGWEPTVELDDGLRRMLAWVRQFDANGIRVPEKEVVV
jgi:dTDP-glucose 4,6-dehydratase